MSSFKIERTERDIVTPENDILGLLRSKKFPIQKDLFLAELEETAGWSVSRNTLDKYIDCLIDSGYDIKDINDEIVLVRYSVDSQDKYYRILGEVECPFIVAADPHIGAKTFAELCYNNLVEDIEEYSVTDVLLPGDIFQGRGVHRMEMSDVRLLSTTDQINEGARLFNRMPRGTRLHAVLGNHEEKIKGSIDAGLDMLQGLKSQLSSKLEYRYYGHVAKLQVDKEYDLLMLHGSGGLAYSIVYMMQKIDRNLIEQPNFLVAGHLHQLYAIPRPGHRYYIMGGTMQKESSYLINKGIVAQVGYLIVDKFNNAGSHIIYRTPETW